MYIYMYNYIECFEDQYFHEYTFTNNKKTEFSDYNFHKSNARSHVTHKLRGVVKTFSERFDQNISAILYCIQWNLSN